MFGIPFFDCLFYTQKHHTQKENQQKPTSYTKLFRIYNPGSFS